MPPHYGFEPSYDKFTTFKVTGAGAATRIDVVEHSWQEEVDALDVTDTSAAGVQALIAGIFRGEGNFKAVWKSTLTLNASVAPKISAGVKGIWTFLYSNSYIPYSVPALIVSIQSVAAVANRVEWNGKIRLDSLSGAYVQPS